jgi:transcriptional regulator with XRE-family HTH domain
MLPGTSDQQKRAFAEKLIAAMNERGWNQSELARRATAHFKGDGEGVERAHISRYVNRITLPGPTRLEAIAKALKTTAAELLPSRLDGIPPDDTVNSVADAGNGNARLRVDREVPWPLALEILQLLQGGKDD